MAADRWLHRKTPGRRHCFSQPQPEAVRKVRARSNDFRAAGWTEQELFDGSDPGSRPGLVYCLRPEFELTDIRRYYCVLVGPPDGNGFRTRQRFFRKPVLELVAEIGDQPLERDRWRAGFYTEALFLSWFCPQCGEDLLHEVALAVAWLGWGHLWICPVCLQAFTPEQARRLEAC